MGTEARGWSGGWSGGVFGVCLIVGRLLRGARYATARVVDEGGTRRVRKRRLPHAPLLVGLGGPLVAALDTGVRVLPQRAWAERERLLWHELYGASIRVERDGTLVLPCLAGRTLAELLEDPALGAPERRRAIGLAVDALAALHRRGVTHGDAMAENVMVDLAAGAARWFDFETVHDARRPEAWRRADDVRALLATIVVRSARDALAATVRLVRDAYPDEGVWRVVAGSFVSPFRRALPFHLGQAALSLARFTELGRLLAQR